MKKLIATMAAALALAATQVSAQGGGGAGGSGSGAGSGQGGEGGAGASAAGGAVSGSEKDRIDQSRAQQQAPSVTGTEGAGGKRPQPQAQGQGDERRYGDAPAQRSGPEGRPATQTPSQATTTPAAPGQPAANAQPSEVSGRVALVSAADGEIGIDSGTATTQIKVAPDAQITVNGKRGSLKDIHQGAQVRASLERGEDGMQAKKIEVTSSATGSGAGK